MLLLKQRSSSKSLVHHPGVYLYGWADAEVLPCTGIWGKKHIAYFNTTFVLGTYVLVIFINNNAAEQTMNSIMTIRGTKTIKAGEILSFSCDFTVLKALSSWLVILFMINVCIASQHIIHSVCSSRAPISKAPARQACNNRILIFKRDASACVCVWFCTVDSYGFDNAAACPTFFH